MASPPPPTAIQPPASGVGRGSTTGYVQGQIQDETWERRFWGGRLLLAVGVLTLIVAIVVGGPGLLRQLGAALMPIILLAGLILLLPLLLGRGNGGGSGMAQVGWGIARGTAALARAGTSGARSSAGALGRTGATTFFVPLRRFRIQDALGTTTSCLLVGEVLGDLMRQGDLVSVEGRKNRDGVIKTNLVRVLDGPGGTPRLAVRARVSVGFQVAQVADVLAKIVAIGLVALVVVMLVGWSSTR